MNKCLINIKQSDTDDKYREQLEDKDEKDNKDEKIIKMKKIIKTKKKKLK